jgi:hypothetical protein
LNTAKKFAIAATSAVVVGGVAVAGVVVADRLSGSNASALAKVVPSNAVAFGSVNLDPKASQKIKFNDLFERVEKNSGQDFGVKASELTPAKFLDEALEGCDAPSRAWIGDVVGVAVLPTKTDEPHGALYVQSNDRDAADKFVKAIGTGADCSFRSASSIDGWVILGSEEDTANKVSPDASGFKSLSDNKEFSSDIGSIDDEGLLTFWVDTNSDYLLNQAGDSATELKSVNSVFGTLRANDNSIELFSHASTDADAFKTNGSVTDVLKGVPDSAGAVFAVTGITDFSNVAANPKVAEQTQGMLTPEIASVFEHPMAVAGGDFNTTPTGALYSAAPEALVRSVVTSLTAMLGDESATAGLFNVETLGDVVRVSAPTQLGVPAGNTPLMNTDAFEDSIGSVDESVAVLYASAEALDFAESAAGVGDTISGVGLNVSKADGGVDATFRVGIKR